MSMFNVTSTFKILLQMDVVCTSRMPQFFLITLMTSGGNALNETRQHQPGQALADFSISLPQSVDVCSLHVRISAGNSAGMSAPSEAVEVGKFLLIQKKVSGKVQLFCKIQFVQVTAQTPLLLPPLLLLVLLQIAEVKVEVMGNQE